MINKTVKESVIHNNNEIKEKIIQEIMTDYNLEYDVAKAIVDLCQLAINMN
jgi:hypothetical protein